MFCQNCGKSGAKSTCGKCKFVHYCNSDCQKNDWNKHKKMCNQYKEKEESRIKTNLIEWINSKDLPVRVVIISGIGRCLVATRNINKGSFIMSSESYGTALEKGNDDRCPTCFENIDDDSQEIECDNCHQIIYCSSKCKSENEKFHNIICDNIEDIDHLVLDKINYPGVDLLFNINSKYGPQGLTNNSFSYDSAILKLVIAILCYKYKEEHIINPDEIVSNFRFKNIMEGESHYDELIGNETIANALNYLANVLLQVIPIKMRVDKVTIKKLILVVKYNFKYLSSISFIHFGIAYYPGAIFINHSCLPNSVYCTKNNGRLIEFRAVCDIKIGEEITCSYVEEYETREHRQKFLLDNYNFNCKCLRCQTPLEKSMDRYLCGYYCNDCKYELTIKEEDKSKYECIKCKKIYEKEYLLNKYRKVSEFFDVARSVIQHNESEACNIVKQIVNSNDMLVLNPYNAKSIRIYMMYVVLLMQNRSHEEFLIYWKKIVNCYKYILGREMLSQLMLYVMFIREFVVTFREDGSDGHGEEIRGIISNIEEGDRIARICCGENHVVTKFTHVMSESFHNLAGILN